jgi:hypothetical protein
MSTYDMNKLIVLTSKLLFHLGTNKMLQGQEQQLAMRSNSIITESTDTDVAQKPVLWPPATPSDGSWFQLPRHHEPTKYKDSHAPSAFRPVGADPHGSYMHFFDESPGLVTPVKAQIQPNYDGTFNMMMPHPYPLVPNSNCLFDLGDSSSRGTQSAKFHQVSGMPSWLSQPKVIRPQPVEVVKPKESYKLFGFELNASLATAASSELLKSPMHATHDPNFHIQQTLNQQLVMEADSHPEASKNSVSVSTAPVASEYSDKFHQVGKDGQGKSQASSTRSCTKVISSYMFLEISRCSMLMVSSCFAPIISCIKFNNSLT